MHAPFLTAPASIRHTSFECFQWAPMRLKPKWWKSTTESDSKETETHCPQLISYPFYFFQIFTTGITSQQLFRFKISKTARNTFSNKLMN